MSSYFERLARDPRFRKPDVQIPVGAGELGAALQELVRQQVADQLAKQTPPVPLKVPQHLRGFTEKAPSNDWPPPPPRTAPPRDFTLTVERDGAGRILLGRIGDLIFKAERDANGRMLRIVKVDETPTLPAPPIQHMAEAREGE